MDLQRNLEFYLDMRGWSSQDPGRAGQPWHHERSGLFVAVPRDVQPDSLDWTSIIQRLAEVELAPAAQVGSQIMLLATDVANIRAANDLVVSDTIPYPVGVALVQSVWTMFRSCATTAMKVRARIGGHYDPRADEITQRARMAHTKRGSYIVPLLLPVTEPVAIDQALVDAALPEPSERRVMRTFAEAMTKVAGSSSSRRAGRTPQTSPNSCSPGCPQSSRTRLPGS